MKRLANWVLVLTVGILGAGQAHRRSVADLLRDADQAFASGDFLTAEHLYAQAQERSTDPGLSAFNRGVCLARLGRWMAAEDQFRCCLEEPGPRSARAYYNLGTCLLNQAGASDARLLKEAIACLERSLTRELDEAGQTDARRNLELAKWRWVQATAQTRDAGDSPTDDPTQPPPPEEPADTQKAATQRSNDAATTGQHGSPNDSSRSDRTPDSSSVDGPTKAAPGAGRLRPISDDEHGEPVTAADVEAHLQAAAQRNERARRQAVGQRSFTAPVRVRDW